MKKKNYYTGILASLLLASPMAGAEDKYPASDFKPTVVYQDAEYKPNQSSGSGSSQNTSSADPNYPAANFQPKVLFKDDDYKPSKSTGVTSSSPQRTQTVSSEGAEDESDYSLGLVVLVLAGLFFFFSKKGLVPVSKKGRAQPARNTSGVTGVAKYLQEMEGAAVSGVARYLEKQNLGSATGVAKYLAKQAGSARKSASAQLSGVDKYLRDKG